MKSPELVLLLLQNVETVLTTSEVLVASKPKLRRPLLSPRAPDLLQSPIRSTSDQPHLCPSSFPRNVCPAVSMRFVPKERPSSWPVPVLCLPTEPGSPGLFLLPVPSEIFEEELGRSGSTDQDHMSSVPLSVPWSLLANPAIPQASNPCFRRYSFAAPSSSPPRFIVILALRRP